MRLILFGLFAVFIAANADEDPCFQTGKYENINNIDVVKEVNDAESCQKHCQELSACEFWTYNANKKVCRRQTEKAPTAVGSCAHCTRGPKYCQVSPNTTISTTATTTTIATTTTSTISNDNCFEVGNYEGNDIDVIFDLNDAVSCQKECQKIYECKFWTYNPNSWDGRKRCYRQRANANETLGTNAKAVRGPRMCPDYCATVNKGEFGFCSCKPNGIQCGEDEGDCDSDDECQDGLFCSQLCPASLGFDSETNCCATRKHPVFESDYLELVKDLPEVFLGPSYGYKKYKSLSVYGPNAFPVLTDNDGYAYVVAGKFGMGKFMVFPWVEEYLQQPHMHGSQKKLLDNTYEWMIKDNPLKAATNMENLNASLATYVEPGILTGNCFETGTYVGNNIDCVFGLNDAVSCQRECLKHPKCKFWTYNSKSWDGKKRCYRQTANANENLGTNSKAVRGPKMCPGDSDGYDYQNFNLFFAGDLTSWSEESVQKLKEFISNGGNVIFGSAFGSGSGSGSDSDPMRKLHFFLGVLDDKPWKTTLEEDKIIYTNTIPSEENVLSEVLSGAINGHLPLKVDMNSLAIKRIYDFYSSPILDHYSAHVMWTLGSEFTKFPIYEVIEKAYLGILDNYETRNGHYPDFVSFFQSTILPAVLQTNYNSKLLRKAPTTFPPDVNPEDNDYVTKTIKVDWKYKKPEGCWDMNCERIRFTRNYISTKFYAVPGKLFTVSIPEEQIGKVQFRINIHKDNLMSKNKKILESNESYVKRPGLITQVYYPESLSNSTINMMSPYGGTIYVDRSADASFDMVIDGVIEMPYFIGGETTNDEFYEMMTSLKSPMVELDFGGSIIFTTPTEVIYKNEILHENLSAVADTWKLIMDKIQWMIGYKLPRPMRYVTDIEITAGGAHAGYPMMQQLSSRHPHLQLSHLSTNPGLLAYHEIGHNLQESWSASSIGRWNPTKTSEVTNLIFGKMVVSEVFGGDHYGFFREEVIQFGATNRTLENLRLMGPCYLAAYIGPHFDFGWTPFANTFKAYLKMPKNINPNTDEEKHSTWAKLMSLNTEHNLVPYFQWWGWIINQETINATQHLPTWDMVHKMDEIVEEGRNCDGSFKHHKKDCCTEKFQCDFGEGPCKSDDQCKGYLICGTKNCVGDNFKSSDNCCTEPYEDPGCDTIC